MCSEREFREKEAFALCTFLYLHFFHFFLFLLRLAEPSKKERRANPRRALPETANSIHEFLLSPAALICYSV